MVTATWNGTQGKVYLDTVLCTSPVNHGAPHNPIAGEAKLGSNYTYEYIEGKLDDVGIYNRAISSSEIDSLFHINGWTGK